MIDYGVDIGNVNGVLGNYTGKNASGATATDGTPFIAAFIDDIWGPKQALMDLAGLIPDGVTESVGASQILESMRKGYALGAGYVVQYEKNDLPSVLGDRVLLLTGQGILVSSYPELTAEVYVGDGNNATADAYYRADDAAGTIRNTTGIYLILPDYRGVVPRGLDVAGSIDPDGSSRTLGSLQIDASQGHDHQLVKDASSGSGGLTPTGTIAGTGATSLPYQISNTGGAADVMRSNTDPIEDINLNGTPRISSETRMYNVATTYAITY